MAELSRVRAWAEGLIALHLADAPGWSFGFDNAKTRAGLCNYTERRISVSKYLAARYDDDEILQVLLHEVAHALAGPAAAHGPAWKATARRIGYLGQRLHHGSIATEHASWIGTCPNGHVHYRYRRPSRPLACGRCARAFDPRYRIIWSRRAA